MSDIKFTPEHKIINELFGRDVTYFIPDYQRPYSWDCLGKSDKNNQVNVMWDDLYSYYQLENQNTYFIGSMVLIGNGKLEYEVIDGQQRLTTLILLFSALNRFLNKHKDTGNAEFDAVIKQSLAIINDILFNTVIRGVIVVEKKVKIIRQADTFNYDEVLDQAVRGEDFDDARYPGSKPEEKEIAKRYFSNRDYFVKKFEENFLTNQKFEQTDFVRFNNFIEFLKNRVSVVRILTGNFDIAYHVFEILNNRGLPLSNKDLFRNFIIKEFDKIKSERPGLEPSKKWTDLDKQYELTDDFMGRWVESTKGGQQRASAFNDITKDIYESQYKETLTKKKIEVFYDDIYRDLAYYDQIRYNTVDHPVLRGQIEFLLNCGNLRYSMNLLLAISRKFGGLVDTLQVHRLVSALELYQLNTLSHRFSYREIYQAINHINQNQIEEAIESIIIDQESLEHMKAMIVDAHFYNNDEAKLVLGKYYWIKSSKIPKDDLLESSLLYDRTTLEHIIPQYPESGSNWFKDFNPQFLDNYTYRLGNMTLLTMRINAAAKNYDFQKKKKEYAKTALAMTHSLSLLPTITEKDILDRHKEITSTLVDYLDERVNLILNKTPTV